MRLTMANRSKVLLARRSIRVSVTTSPGRGRRATYCPCAPRSPRTHKAQAESRLPGQIMIPFGFNFGGWIVIRHVVTITMAATMLAVLTASGQAADNAQQQRMKDCNQQAAGMAGGARKNFISSCLSGKTATGNHPNIAHRGKVNCAVTPASRSIRPATNRVISAG
jgi:hypothetical protein